MRFRFKSRKAIQAIALFLRPQPSKRMNYMRLLKLLYVADRECLRECGRPITGDSVVAMKRGPVLSQTCNIIKGEDILAPEWAAFVRLDRYELELKDDPGVPDLSRFELGILQRVAADYADKDEWDMVEITHGFPEWEKNDPGDSSRPIPLEDILEAVGRSADLKAIEQDARDEAAFDRVFGQ